MVVSGCILIGGTVPILWLFYRGITGGAEYLHLLIWGFEGVGNSSSLISTEMTGFSWCWLGIN